MERRNFFSKIGKGLLGVGVLGALPQTEVEPVSEPVTKTAYDLYTIPSGAPKGYAEINGVLYIVDSDNADKPS